MMMAHVQSEQGVAIPRTAQAAKVRTTSSRNSSAHRSNGNWLYIIAIPVLVIMIAPYVYLLLQSFAPWDQVDKVFVPGSPTLRSYQWVLSGGGFTSLPLINALANSFLVTIIDSFSIVIVGAIVGYALSMLEFRGKRFINNFILFQ